MSAEGPRRPLLMAGPLALIQPVAESRTDGDTQPDLTFLALASNARDPHATRALMVAVTPVVRTVCRGVLGNAHLDLDDTVQDCLLQILRALPNFRAEAPLLHYAKRITLRTAISARKRGRQRENRLRAFAEEAHVRGGTPGDEPFALKLVEKVIEILPSLQAETFLMRTVLGFSLEEIAQTADVPLNTAKSRLRVAKETLKVHLASEH